MELPDLGWRPVTLLNSLKELLNIIQKVENKTLKVNRAKKICETLPFEWLDITPALLDITMKRRTFVFI